jgi:hypothetical protein
MIVVYIKQVLSVLYYICSAIRVHGSTVCDRLCGYSATTTISWSINPSDAKTRGLHDWFMHHRICSAFSQAPGHLSH